jgi:hypothetical protein
MKNLKAFESWNSPDEDDVDAVSNRDLTTIDQIFEPLIKGDRSKAATPGGFFAMRRKGTDELWLLNSEGTMETADFLNYRVYYVTGKNRLYRDDSEGPEIEYDDDIYDGDYLSFATDLYQGNTKELSDRSGGNWSYMSSSEEEDYPIKLVTPYYTDDPKKIQRAIEEGDQPLLYKLNPESAGHVIDSVIGFREFMKGKNPQMNFDSSTPLLLLLHDVFGDKLQGFQYEKEFKEIIKTAAALRKYDRIKGLI